MTQYYINKKTQPNGDNEVHVQTCNYFPAPENRDYLGDFTNCHNAVAHARTRYRQVNGCKYCCNACHTQ